MARFSISDEEEETPIPPVAPKYQRKSRFSIEEPSDLERRMQIAGKSFGKGASQALSFLYELGKTPFSLTAKDPKEKLQKAAELSKYLEEKFDLSPPESKDMIDRFIAEGSKALGSGIIGGPTGAVSSLTGALAGQTAREFGAPEIIATPLDVLTSAITPTNIFSKGTQLTSKSPEIAKRIAVTEAENLPKVRGILKEPSKITKFKPAITSESLETFNKKIGSSIEKQTDKIMEESLLGKRLESQGTIIGDLISDAYDHTINLASKNPNKINIYKISDSIKRQADRIEKSAPSLADPTREVVSKLRKYQKDFSSKGMSAEQLTNQWQEINKDLTSLYAKKELTGAEELYRKSLEEVKDKLLKQSTRDLKDKNLIDAFKKQNKLYAEAQKFEKAKNILEPVFEGGFNPNKFRQVFTSDKKFSDLKKSLGTNNAYRLRDIQKYYSQPIENMKKGFKVKSLLNLEDVVKGAITKKLLGLPVAVAVKITPHAYGKLLTSENTQNLWVHLMRSVKDGSVRSVQKYADSLEKELEESSE